jgi:2'-5' RNA ligase
MRLFAAIVPPRDILEDVSRTVRSATATEPEPAPRRLFGRRPRAREGAGGDGGSAGTMLAGSPELDTPSPAEMYLPITAFGNVTRGDSIKLANALRTEAAGWRPPTVSLAGGTALEFPGDESVWVKLDGDVDGLLAIGRGVPLVVQRLGFFVDRRVFRPWLPVATITEHTTAPYLERVVEALDHFHGTSWTVDSVFLMRRVPDAPADEFEVMEQMPLASS